jgi:uncharacterized glyoxalase superfamily metalloenzyme YdcJ
MSRVVSATELRASFARRMADMYGDEVPAYHALVEVSAAVNADVLARDGAEAERLGSIERVTAERHGAIRVGTPRELHQVSRLFAALGMFPVGFYDLREAARSSVPVVSTAFRPVDPDELARNPFRMFTSLLVTDDRRFFDADLQARLDTFLARRTLFPPRLLALAEQAIAAAGLPAEDAQEFLTLATAAFALSSEPVDRAWYAELERVSAVAADIGGVTSTHINHLTPRVLDIDALYARMSARGIEMIDAIQGPPRWDGPDVLLRQTSFRALAESRRFREADGSITTGALRVRFGEVEARGIALTPAGRDHYDRLLVEVDRRVREGEPRAEAMQSVWSEQMPRTERELLERGFGYFTVEASGRVTPIVYEDFLPRSAAGIFQSNLTGDGRRSDDVAGSARDAGWLSDVIGASVADPFALYAAQQQASLDAAGAPGAADAAVRDPRAGLAVSA